MPDKNNKLTPLDACDPALNATVSASAGSGKTWLLITRIVRLLIAGAEPGNIIALTFTRKAAGEMQLRLNERLFAMATATDDELDQQLEMIGCDRQQQTKVIAAGLYEKLMHSLYPVRIQTFHSFCQDILSRFPLEADIPPGFDLIEDSSLLERQALQMLFDEARTSSKTSSAQRPDKRQLNDALDTIMQFCNGPDNTTTSLHSFLAHRSDWWAYSSREEDPVAFASRQLSKALQLETVNMGEQAAGGSNKLIEQFLDDTRQELMIFANLLREIGNKNGLKQADSIDEALNTSDRGQYLSLINSAFLTREGKPLVQGRKHSAAMEKKLGSENTEHFLELHLEISTKLEYINEQLKRLQTLMINNAWYYCGNRYVEIFQQLKTETRQLDFTDLEWKCYQLLQHSDNAHWVQYKIDQRIDHILIDEFQDTNPTQWQLLSPILEEIAANPEQRPRSVFLVGDEKQSIYSFRRANPALQAQASKWLADRLDAKATPLDSSRRSSQAIIDCVNHIFEQAEIQTLMPGFTTHGTHLKALPGKVVLCDLFEEGERGIDSTEGTEEQAITFRNPLLQPRDISSRTLRHDEADFIAGRIKQLVDSVEPVTDGSSVRAMEFADIMILMRNRTHTAIYEDALKQHGIPYIGNKKGGLLDNLEIRDLNCLLNTLITPYDNLGLAQVLKSPIFSASDEDMILLARQTAETHWYKRLMLLASEHGNELSRPLQRAARLLPHWQQLADHLPVHDCLDRIFSEGNIIKRYVAANRQERKQNIAANCQRFLELSLETDAGRYPSISRFLQRLLHLQSYSANPPEEPLSQSGESRVRIMTIHGSKGLESPVVFLADCNSTASNKNAYASLVSWPADKSRPEKFQLQLNKDNTDTITQQVQQEKLNEQKREELNLLYVALTRAREQLFISGSAGRRSREDSWYQIISNGLDTIAMYEADENRSDFRVFRHLAYDKTNTGLQKSNETACNSDIEIDERLLRPIAAMQPSNTSIAPSQQNEDKLPHDTWQSKTEDNDESIYHRELSTWRGTIIHRVIEMLCNSGIYPATEVSHHDIRQRLITETIHTKPAFTKYIDECMEEALTTFNHPDFSDIFDPLAASQSFNEMPVMHLHQRRAVYGIVDRVVKKDDVITVIDYKSHQLGAEESIQDAASQFATQLEYYRLGVSKLWPKYTVKTAILFTHHKEIVWLE
jgi:ATP-dependent helicase/nuclease subunit A